MSRLLQGDRGMIRELTAQVFGENGLRWPHLDVDLTLEMIKHPERFPLISREGA